MGWAVIAGTVAVFDAWALRKNRDTISRFMWKARDHKVAKWVVVGGWVALTWHLLLGDKKFLPDQQSSLYRKVHPLYVVRAWVIQKPKS